MEQEEEALRRAGRNPENMDRNKIWVHAVRRWAAYLASKGFGSYIWDAAPGFDWNRPPRQITLRRYDTV
jgi:hypothetical protein